MALVANEGVHGTERWVTAGTAVGMMLVEDINLGPAGAYPGNVKALDDGLGRR